MPGAIHLLFIGQKLSALGRTTKLKNQIIYIENTRPAITQKLLDKHKETTIIRPVNHNTNQNKAYM